MRAFRNTPQRSQTDDGDYRQSDLVAHLAGVQSHDGCAPDAIVAFASVDRGETGVRGDGGGPMHDLDRESEGCDRSERLTAERRQTTDCVEELAGSRRGASCSAPARHGTPPD